MILTVQKNIFIYIVQIYIYYFIGLILLELIHYNVGDVFFLNIHIDFNFKMI